MAALVVLLAGGMPAGVPPALPHDTHVSHTRMVLEGTTVALRIRFFHDDLERGLQGLAGDSTLKILPDAHRDSLVGVYVERHFTLELDGRRLHLEVTESGLEQDEAAQMVAWYVLEGDAPAGGTRLTVYDALLFEVFPDQQNLFQLLRLPENRQRTLYFNARDPRPQAFAP